MAALQLLTVATSFATLPGARYFRKERLAMKIKVIIHTAEEGGYWAEVPALPGCYTQAETREELQTHLREAILGWLEAASDEASA